MRIKPPVYSEAFLRHLINSERFRECCRLIREMWGIKWPCGGLLSGEKNKNIDYWNCWLNIEECIQSINDSPAVIVRFKEDLKRACLLSGIKSSERNIHLMYMAAVFGPIYTLSRLKKDRVKRFQVGGYNLVPRKALFQAFIVIRYLTYLIQTGKKDIDPGIEAYIDSITYLLSAEGWGYYPRYYFDNKKQSNYGEWCKQYDEMKLDYIVYVFYHITKEIEKEQKGNEEEKKFRDREKRREYIFWRLRRKGKLYREIADDWNKIKKYGEAIDEDIVSKAIRKYKKERSSLIREDKTLLRLYCTLLRKKYRPKADLALIIFGKLTNKYLKTDIKIIGENLILKKLETLENGS